MIQWSRLKSGQSARDLMRCDSRLAKKVIVPVHSFSDCTHCLPEKPVVFSDSDSTPLLSQDIFTFILRTLINNCIKPPQLLFRPSPVCSPCPQVSLKPGSGPALESVPYSLPFAPWMLFPRLLPLPGYRLRGK
jgi:hypothetical protein